MIYTHRYSSPLGQILLAADDEGLTGLWFVENQRHMGEGLSAGAEERPSPFFDEATQWLDIYFSGRDPGFTPTLHLTGPDFRRHVGELLLQIPYGITTTYGELVSDLSLPYMARGLGPLLDLLGVDCERRDEPNLASLVVTGRSGEVGAEYGTGAAEERARVYAFWTRLRT